MLPGPGRAQGGRAGGRRQARRRVPDRRDDPRLLVQHARRGAQHHQHDQNPGRARPCRRRPGLPGNEPVRDRVFPRRPHRALPSLGRADLRLDRRGGHPRRGRGLPGVYGPSDSAGQDRSHRPGVRLHPRWGPQGRKRQARPAAAGCPPLRRADGPDARPRHAVRRDARARSRQRPHPRPGLGVCQPLQCRTARRRRLVLRLLAGRLPPVWTVAPPRRLPVPDLRAGAPARGLGRRGPHQLTSQSNRRARRPRPCRRARGRDADQSRSGHHRRRRADRAAAAARPASGRPRRQ